MARSRSTPRPTNELGTQVPASRFTHPIVFFKLDRYPVTSLYHVLCSFSYGIFAGTFRVRNVPKPAGSDLPGQVRAPATTLYFRCDPAESEAGFPVRS